MANTTEYKVTGMTCGNCEKHVREEVEQLENILGIEVSAQDGKLVVTFDGDPNHEGVVAAVDEAGYTAEPVKAT